MPLTLNQEKRDPEVQIWKVEEPSNKFQVEWVNLEDIIKLMMEMTELANLEDEGKNILVNLAKVARRIILNKLVDSQYLLTEWIA